MIESKSLHVFHNGTDWYVAESAEDASRVAEDHYTCDAADVGAEPGDLEQLPDDKPLTILDTENHEGPSTTKTCAEWCASNGRGFLGSTEF